MILAATCLKCQTPFRYGRADDGLGRPRTVCPACLKERKRVAKRKGGNRRKARRKARREKIQECRLLEGEETGMALLSDGVMKCDREEVAKACGISESRVRDIERRALAKVRRDPELRRCYRLWLIAGRPTPTKKWGKTNAEGVSYWLIQWVMGMLRWRGAAAVMAEDPATQAEAAAMYRLIEPFNDVLARVTNEMLGAEWPGYEH